MKNIYAERKKQHRIRRFGVINAPTTFTNINFEIHWKRDVHRYLYKHNIITFTFIHISPQNVYNLQCTMYIRVLYKHKHTHIHIPVPVFVLIPHVFSGCKVIKLLFYNLFSFLLVCLFQLVHIFCLLELVCTTSDFNFNLIGNNNKCVSFSFKL